MKEISIYIEQCSRLKSHLCSSQSENLLKSSKLNTSTYESTLPEVSLIWVQQHGSSDLNHVFVISCQVNWALTHLGRGSGSAQMACLCTMLSLIFQLDNLGLFIQQLWGPKRTREGRHQCVSIFQISTCITLEVCYGPNQVTWSSL